MLTVVLCANARLLTQEYIRDTKDEYRMVEVSDWIDNDESLEGALGY